jgi:hypothetical protein
MVYGLLRGVITILRYIPKIYTLKIYLKEDKVKTKDMKYKRLINNLSIILPLTLEVHRTFCKPLSTLRTTLA